MLTRVELTVVVVMRAPSPTIAINQLIAARRYSLNFVQRILIFSFLE